MANTRLAVWNESLTAQVDKLNSELNPEPTNAGKKGNTENDDDNHDDADAGTLLGCAPKQTSIHFDLCVE